MEEGEPIRRWTVEPVEAPAETPDTEPAQAPVEPVREAEPVPA